jgi:hypothetical protein
MVDMIYGWYNIWLYIYWHLELFICFFQHVWFSLTGPRVVSLKPVTWPWPCLVPVPRLPDSQRRVLWCDFPGLMGKSSGVEDLWCLGTITGDSPQVRQVPSYSGHCCRILQGQPMGFWGTAVSETPKYIQICDKDMKDSMWPGSLTCSVGCVFVDVCWRIPVLCSGMGQN